MTKLLDKVSFKPSSENVNIQVQVFKEIEGESNETFIEFEIIEYNEYGNTKQKIKFLMTSKEFQNFVNKIQDVLRKIEDYYNIIKEKMYEVKV